MQRSPQIATIALTTATLLHGQFSFQETFTSTEAPGWQLSQGNTDPGPRLTANSPGLTQDPEVNDLPLDADGQGWLRLATRTLEQANSAWLDTPIPSAGNNITVGFDFTIWDRSSGTGADGMTFFFYDATVPFSDGAFGGSLGYANRSGDDGLAGGYLGVGLDVYGNFSNPSEGRNGGIARLPSEVVLRGPGSGQIGYEYLAGTDGTNTTVTGNPAIDDLETILGLATNPLAYENQDFRPDQDAGQYRYVQIELTDTNQLTVSMRAGFTGPLVELFTADVSSFARPDLLRIGFSGGTGGVNQVYEVRNLQVDTTGTTSTWYWTNADADQWTTNSNWSPLGPPADHADLVFTDQFPDTTGPMVVLVDGADKVIRHAFLAGEHSYTINPDSSQKWVMNTDGAGSSYISILSSPSGNAAHSINVDLDLQNELRVQHLVKDQTLTLGGDIETNGNNLYLNSYGIVEVDGVISGSADVIAQGSGTKVLTGSNTYTGETTIEGGVLQIESDAALGSTAAGTTVLDGATLALSNDITTPSSETLSLTGSGIGGVGALVSVDGDNTWQGDITLADDSSIGTLDTATLTLNGSIDGSGNTLSFAPQSGGTIQVDGIVSGTGTEVIFEGEGTTVIGYNATNTYTGDTVIRSGTVQSNSSIGAFSETAFGTSTSNIEVGDAETQSGDDIRLVFNTESPGGSPTWTHIIAGREIDVNDFGNDVTLGVIGGDELYVRDAVNLARNLILDAALDSGLLIDGDGGSGELTGTGDIIIEGGGGVTLTGDNSRSGDTIINNGTLTIRTATDALDDTGRVSLADSTAAELVINSSETIGSLSGGGAAGGNVTINTGVTLTTGSDNSSSTYSGSIQGAGNLTKTGTGTSTFNGVSTFTGALQVNAGTALIDTDNAFADGMDVILDGGTLATNGRVDTLGDFTLASSSTIDFRGENGGFLTFDSMTRSSGTLTIDQWAGSLTGNGNTRLQVSASSLGGSLLTNTTFNGWGEAELIDLGAGLYELVPALSGFTRWTDGNAGNNNWTTGGNWDSGAPNGSGARAYFGNDPAGTGLQEVIVNSSRKVGTLILDSTEHNYDFRSRNGNNREIQFEQLGATDAFLIVAGDQEHHIGYTNTNTERLNLDLRDNLQIQNNSTAANGLTIGTLDGDHYIETNGNDLTVSGTSRTILHSTITEGGALIKNDVGTLRLTDTSSSFSGGVTLNEGSLEIGANGALGSGSFTINGGNIEAYDADRSISNVYTINDDYAVIGANDLTFSGTGTIAAGSHSVSVGTGLNHTLSGTVGGTGALVKEGDGTLSFSGNNKTFSGGLVVNSGTVEASRGGNITLGASDSSNNLVGSGAITVNSGGTFNLTQTANNGITLRGEALTNNGGTISISSTGDNGSRDFLIGINSSDTGQLISNSGVTTINVGDDTRVRANSSISVSGGTVNINTDDSFTTNGTSGNGATVSASGTGILNIDISGTRSDEDTIRLSEHDTMTVDGAAAAINLAGETNSAIDIDGSLNLFNNGIVTVEQGTTTISSTAVVSGGTAGTAGTLELRDDLVIAGDADITDAPNLTFNTADDVSISGTAVGTSTKGWGTVTQSGTGTTTIDASINNIDAGTVVINDGTLMLGSDDQIANTTNMVLAGGTFNTNDNDEILGTLTLSADSIIDFGAINGDGSILKFADSSGVAWNPAATLTVINWEGTFQTGDGTDQLFFGTDGNGLTAAQRAQIVFADFPGNDVIHLNDGEVVPVPEPRAVAAAIGLAGLIFWRERKRLKPAIQKIRGRLTRLLHEGVLFDF